MRRGRAGGGHCWEAELNPGQEREAASVSVSLQLSQPSKVSPVLVALGLSPPPLARQCLVGARAGQHLWLAPASCTLP